MNKELLLTCCLILAACGDGAAVKEGARASNRETPALREPLVASTQAHPALLSAPPISTSVAVEAAPRDVRMPTDWLADLRWDGAQRVAHAKRAKGDVVKELFAKAEVGFPAKEVLFRVFKDVNEFEVWAGDGASPLKRIATYGICAASGVLGPKRREGDLQVPEGYYKVGYYHPMSAYYLSAQVNYPNASDKVRGGPSPGSDILIHGRCASIGCISMTDERIEEIYLMGWGAFMLGQPTHIHIFPSRDIEGLLAKAEHAEHHAFWQEIRPGLTAFDASHRLPAVKIASDGRYEISPAAIAPP